MISRLPPSPDRTSKIRSNFYEFFCTDPFRLIDPALETFNPDHTDLVIARLQARSINPDRRDNVRRTPLIAAAMALPVEKRVPLVCTILQLGGDPNIPIATLSANESSTFLHGTFSPDQYNKALAQLILSYGYERSTFDGIVEKLRGSRQLESSNPQLSDEEISIDLLYSSIATAIETAKQAMDEGRYSDAADEFTKAEGNLNTAAQWESNTDFDGIIKADYQARASQCHDKALEMRELANRQAANERTRLLT